LQRLSRTGIEQNRAAQIDVDLNPFPRATDVLGLEFGDRRLPG
jgi:hypothetical protein